MRRLLIAIALAGPLGFWTGNYWHQGGLPKNTVSLDFAAPAANACLALTDTVTGATANDICVMGAPAALDAAVDVSCFVSAANTVTIKYCCNNGTSACANPAAQTYSYAVIH